ncbi:hypothetical protein, partial [Bilophila wadsworthia]|uniref:hypothetical protein n=1 Tax=Bilophila wadsworthia TaxID=35833 RepID=UPI0024332743
VKYSSRQNTIHKKIFCHNTLHTIEKGVSLPDPSRESMGQPAHSNEGEERTEYCHLKNFEGAILK